MNVTSSTIKDLNKRRLEAVRRRLDGESLSEVSQSAGLSVPTVVAAMKAYEAGGWGGVAVKPRGRPATSKALSDEKLNRLRVALIEAAQHVGYPFQATDLWSNARIHSWLTDQGLTLSTATASRYAKAWGLAPASPAPSEKPAQRTEHQRFMAEAKRLKRRLVWVSTHATSALEAESATGPLVLLCAHTARGLCLWAIVPRLEQSFFIDFLNAVQELLQTALAPQIQLNQWIDKSWATKWEQRTGNPVLLLPPVMNATDPHSSHSKPSISTITSQASSTMTALNALPENGDDLLLAPETLTHLQRLEAESIHIMREVVAEADNPVMLYSIGKDSAVMLHLAVKAFYPAPPPFPLLHVDTTWKFQEMYKFRDIIAKELGFELLVHQNEEGVKQGVSPFTHGSELHTDILKTQALKQALDKHGFDVAFGGARRDEEKSRAKERVFSFRTSAHRWEPKSQRPELWNLYNAKKRKGESIRVFPLSNWTELDIWQYIHQQSIPIVPLYFSDERPVVERDGQIIMVDDDRMPLLEGETPEMKRVRFRTLGCYPLTGAVESNATTLPDIIQEMLLATTSERQGRLIDHDTSASMEKKKQEGYF